MIKTKEFTVSHLDLQENRCFMCQEFGHIVA